MALDLKTRMELTFARESVCAARNRLYAAKLKQAGDQQSANLLSALAKGSEISARRSLIFLRGRIGDPAAYMHDLQAQKRTAARQDYPAAQAEAADEPSAAAVFEQLTHVSDNHAARLAGLAAGQPAQAYYVCQVCGYIAADAVPERCPVCGAVPERFKIEAR
jgi:rubrerythrin